MVICIIHFRRLGKLSILYGLHWNIGELVTLNATHTYYTHFNKVKMRFGMDKVHPLADRFLVLLGYINPQGSGD